MNRDSELHVRIYEFGFVPIVEEHPAAPSTIFSGPAFRPSVISSQRLFRSRQVFAASFCAPYQIQYSVLVDRGSRVGL
jgi:hypothetical protein